MKRLILIAGVLLPMAGLTAQTGPDTQKDPEARKILDRVSARTLDDSPIQVDFEYIFEDLVNRETSTEKGSLIIEGDNYRLSIGQSEIYCNGTTTWNYLPEANEVYISDAGEAGGGDEFFINNPSDLFSFYRSGFKYRLKGEIEAMGKTLYEIDIYPEDLDKNYHTVKLLIGRKDERIVSAQAFGKGGANHSIILTNYRRKLKTDGNTFEFDPSSHPGIEIVDTRL